MRRLLTVILPVAISAANASTWSLFGSYPSPVTDARGYGASSWQSGWTITGSATPYVIRVHVFTGSILACFPAPGGAGASGVAYDIGYALFISNSRTSWIYKTTTGGSLYRSFPCPVPGPADLDIRGFDLYVAIPDRNIIAVVNSTTGSLLSTFKGPGSRPTACCGYGITMISDSATHTIYEDGIPVIRGIQTPVGMDDYYTLGQDIDHSIWIVDAATNYIYRYDTSVDVGPASLGRIKALFE
jgi:hypothetical protein